MNMLRIPYESQDFPPGTVQNGEGELRVTWDEILWAAITVGRPNRYAVFQHGNASIYDAFFRWSLIRMALEQRSPTTSYLWRTAAARTLDPSEKAAVSYFLGMTFCKLFATNLLNTPWLLHLDVCRPQLDPILTARARPDLVGQELGSGRWHAFESKGRSHPIDSTVKNKAKFQAQRLVRVNQVACSMHLGAITYFHNDKLQFYWRDPIPEEGKAIEIDLPPNSWRHYYQPVSEIIKNQDSDIKDSDSENDLRISIENHDLEIQIHHLIAKNLISNEWEQTQKIAMESAEIFNENGYQPDGLLVRAGKSWYEKYEESSFDAEADDRDFDAPLPPRDQT